MSVSAIENNVNSLDDKVSNISSRVSSAELKITPNAIVQAINTTDGVGKVKTVGVTVDENGLTVEDGAVIIRDAFNTAIITSNGLKVMYSFSSGGAISRLANGGYSWTRFPLYRFTRSELASSDS